MVGTAFKYKKIRQRQSRTCETVGYSTSLDDGDRYTVHHITSSGPETRRSKSVSLPETKFFELWDARIHQLPPPRLASVGRVTLYHTYVRDITLLSCFTIASRTIACNRFIICCHNEHLL